MQYRIDRQYWWFSSKYGWMICDRGMSSSACPRCGDLLYRVPRRLIDRLFSFGRRRFQCVSRACCWEGNLPLER
jgi:ssDNA-binding Zn-finger/Zn-ribbon topoisomerase 1